MIRAQLRGTCLFAARLCGAVSWCRTSVRGGSLPRKGGYMETQEDTRPWRAVALVTGASRLRGIAAAIALRLAGDGWDVATSYWRPYDATMPWGSEPDDVVRLAD